MTTALRIVIITLTLIDPLVINTLNAQNADQGYIYLDVQDPTLIPMDESTIYTDNLELNGLFNDYDVIQYSISWPGAKTEALKSIYEIHLNGDVFQFYNALKESGLFNPDKVEKAEYYTIDGCNDPVVIP